MLIAWMGLSMTACTGDKDTTDTPVETSDTAPTTDGVLADCATHELPPRPFDEGAGGLLWGDLAADFTVETLDGPWTLSEEWTGCDSYVFVTYFEGGEGDALWSSDAAEILATGPRNTHFFFVSEEGGRQARLARMEALKEAMALGPARSERVHFVTDRLTKIEGSVGEMALDYMDYLPDSAVDIGADRGSVGAPLPVFFGIDREQRWDSGGYIYNFIGGSPLIEMAGYLAHFYNHKAELQHRFDQETATEVVLLEDSVTDRVFVVQAELPADLSGFDTAEFDVGVFCPHRNPYACSEWDRNAWIEVCLDGKKCADRREIVRWITPYWRRGGRRWGMEASPLMGLLSGGTNWFRIVMGPSWERATERRARVSLRLSNQGNDRATGVVRAYTGGTFNAEYNDNHPPFDFDLPASATSAELVVIVSGHGQEGTENCAEWCDHRHQFTINGVQLEEVRSQTGIGSTLGCADAAQYGVSPGQYGNWAPQRAFWCPGLPVAPIRLDLTEHVTPGASNQLTYSASLRGTQPPAGGNISLSVYVSWTE
ncbi:MAG: hypothetical protein KTR31_19510 [Myxococcales bacterium]|nr:hypothetical protein [Myxococcales bacterium]